MTTRIKKTTKITTPSRTTTSTTTKTTTTTPWRAAERRLLKEDSPTVIQNKILASPQLEAPIELERR
jgi:hypothetical protein